MLEFPLEHEDPFPHKIAPQFHKRDEAQLLNVLKATRLKVGVLLNFGRHKVEVKRLVF